MKHKQAILKACALYYGKHRDQAIPAYRAWNAKNAKSAVRHKSIIRPSTEPSIVQACGRGMI